MNTKLSKIMSLISLMGLFWASSPSFAGVFDLPAFLEAEKWSVGFEPEVALSNGTGAALNIKPRYGATDFLNWQGLIGMGSGDRNFRVGALADFEWFPDYDKQPGVSTPLFLEYLRFQDSGLLSFGVKPMVYKTFVGKGADFTPFLSLPLGWNSMRSDLNTFVQIVAGSMVKVPNIPNWRFSAEAGFDVRNSYSYLSGGVTYYH